MFLAGEIICILEHFLWIGSRLFRKKMSILIAEIICSCLQAVYLYLLGSETGMFTAIFALIMRIVCLIKVKKEKKWLPVYLLFGIGYIIIMIFTYEGISSVLITICSLLSLTYNWWFNAQGVRITSIISGIIYMTYQSVLGNPFGALEAFSVLANLIGYCKYKSEEIKKTDKEIEEILALKTKECQKMQN